MSNDIERQLKDLPRRFPRPDEERTRRFELRLRSAYRATPRPRRRAVMLIVIVAALATGVAIGHLASAAGVIDLRATDRRYQLTASTHWNPNYHQVYLQHFGGDTVRRLKAGRYSITVFDRSAGLNFHLRGPGVNERTRIPFKGSITWAVRLRRGTYAYFSDNYPAETRRTFRVTR